jgi:hypothetical protein
MYMRESTTDVPLPQVSAVMRLALLLAALATIYLGVAPGRVLDYSAAGGKDLFPVISSPYVHWEKR